MIRAKLCASGRNSRVDAPGSVSTLASGPATALRTSDSRLPWVSSQPLGRPVVPDV